MYPKIESNLVNDKINEFEFYNLILPLIRIFISNALKSSNPFFVKNPK
jgi:hypothetical protein